jgi:tripartite-type tricarboxylate transporter receptor subunit TctC
MAGVDMVHVPYRGGGPALIDLLAGQVLVMFDTLATSMEHIKAGKLRPLGVTSATRVAVLPGPADHWRNRCRLRGDRVAGLCGAAQYPTGDR